MPIINSMCPNIQQPESTVHTNEGNTSWRVIRECVQEADSLHGASSVMKMAEICFQRIKFIVYIQICTYLWKLFFYCADLYDTTFQKEILQERKQSGELTYL